MSLTRLGGAWGVEPRRGVFRKKELRVGFSNVPTMPWGALSAIYRGGSTRALGICQSSGLVVPILKELGPCERPHRIPERMRTGDIFSVRGKWLGHEEVAGGQ